MKRVAILILAILALATAPAAAAPAVSSRHRLNPPYTRAELEHLLLRGGSYHVGAFTEDDPLAVEAMSRARKILGAPNKRIFLFSSVGAIAPSFVIGGCKKGHSITVTVSGSTDLRTGMTVSPFHFAQGCPDVMPL